MIRALVLLVAAGGAAAQPLPLELPPGAVATVEEVADPGRYALPTGAFSAAAQPTDLFEGRRITRAWRIPEDRADTLAVLRALRDQIVEAGLAPVFDCAGRACGGFDFRTGITLAPPPGMEFELGDFRFLAARDGGRAIGVLVTRTPRGGFVQATEIAPSEAPPLALDPAPSRLGAALSGVGRAVLDGVSFAPGTARLEDPEALGPLAQLLQSQPGMALILVGHSDSTGTAAANRALSRARAEAVRRGLIERWGIAPARLSADGVGALSPRASNATEAGRALNRRVEAVVRAE